MARGPEQNFHKRRYRNCQLYIKRCLTSLIIREMQMKTIVRYYFTPIRMAIIKKKKASVNWYSHYGKQYGGSSKKFKIQLAFDQ